MKSRQRARPGLGLLLSLATCLVPAVAPAAALDRSARDEALRIEFWTIEPNEGQSAGGHSALRIGDLVHHLEHRDDGLIVDRRDPVRDFERSYRLEGNRGIEALRLSLPPAVEDALVRILEARHHERRLGLDALAGLEAELAWIDRALETGRASVTVPGLGILDDEPAGCEAGRSAGLGVLRERIEEGLGSGRLEARIAEARRALHLALDRLASRPPDSSPPPPSSEARARSGMGPRLATSAEPGGAVRRLAEAAQTLEALEAIRDCRGPDPSRLLPVGFEADAVGRRPDLEAPPSRHPAWLAAREALLRSVVRLVESERRDPGLALLLAWSRLVALDSTLERGSLLVVDPYAEAPEPIDLRARGATATELEARERAAEARLRAREEELGEAGRPLEQRLERLEAARHDLAHARRGEAHRAPEPAVDATRSLSERHAAARVELIWPRRVSLDGLASRRRALLPRAKRARRELERELGYALFTRNCVTELLEVLDEALAVDPGTAGFRAARRRDPEAPTGFIPVVAGRLVARHAPVEERVRRPGLRELAIERAARLGRADWVALRESNTLTARTYRPHSADSLFLFFSQGPVWARPLIGVGNLLTGLGGATAGLLTAPLDGGERFLRGIRGVAMSVPELFFFSVRKGTYVVAPDPPAPPASRVRTAGSDADGT